ncbi:MAG: ABC transporter ATP-binding protein [Salibacteraceae bacterium]
MQTILLAEQVQKSYGKKLVLKDVSIGFERAKIYGILGPNGAGKTTFIRMLAGITAPDSGSIYFHGSPVHQPLATKIGYLPEERGLYRKMKAGEHMVYLARLKGLDTREAISNVSEWFEKLEMTTWWDKPVETLSKGMQQRLQFVACVVHRPEILILDEPFSGFDPINAEMITQSILDLREEGKTILLSTHDMHSVEKLCEHVCLIHKGELVLNAPTDEARQQFSDELYHIVFIGSQVSLAQCLGHNYEIVSLEPNGSQFGCKIKAYGQNSSRDLIQRVNGVVEIVAFQKLLPTMHDVFLQIVSEDDAFAEDETGMNQ